MRAGPSPPCCPPPDLHTRLSSPSHEEDGHGARGGKSPVQVVGAGSDSVGLTCPRTTPGRGALLGRGAGGPPGACWGPAVENDCSLEVRVTMTRSLQDPVATAQLRPPRGSGVLSERHPRARAPARPPPFVSGSLLLPANRLPVHGGRAQSPGCVRGEGGGGKVGPWRDTEY